MHVTNNRIDRCPTGKRFKTPFVYNISLSAIMPQASGAKPRLPKSRKTHPRSILAFSKVVGVG